MLYCKLMGKRAKPFSRKSNAFPAIFWAGLIAGILDMTDALVFYYLRGVKPTRILHSIASGLLGPAAYRGGWKTAALGMALHFVIAFGAATVFYIASRKLRFLTRHAVISGLLYGGAIYLFMNRVVVPLSRAARSTAPQQMIPLVNGVLAVVLCVGLTIALVIRRFSR